MNHKESDEGKLDCDIPRLLVLDEDDARSLECPIALFVDPALWKDGFSGESKCGKFIPLSEQEKLILEEMDEIRPTILGIESRLVQSSPDVDVSEKAIMKCFRIAVRAMRESKHTRAGKAFVSLGKFCAFFEREYIVSRLCTSLRHHRNTLGINKAEELLQIRSLFFELTDRKDYSRKDGSLNLSKLAGDVAVKLALLNGRKLRIAGEEFKKERDRIRKLLDRKGFQWTSARDLQDTLENSGDYSIDISALDDDSLLLLLEQIYPRKKKASSRR